MINVIAFDPIKICTDWGHQNDRQNLSFVKYINVVGEKMTRNGRKMRITLNTTCLGESVFSSMGSYSSISVLSISDEYLSCRKCEIP